MKMETKTAAMRIGKGGIEQALVMGIGSLLLCGASKAGSAIGSKIKAKKESKKNETEEAEIVADEVEVEVEIIEPKEVKEESES